MTFFFERHACANGQVLGKVLGIKMNKGNVHLFALVSLLCVCTVTSRPATTAQSAQLQHNLNTTSEPTPDSENRTSVEPTNAFELSTNETGTPSPDSNLSTHDIYTDDYKTSSSEDPFTSIPAEPTTKAAAAAAGSFPTERPERSKKAAIIILVCFLMLIAALVVLLFLFWRKGRRYSFDLTNTEHDTPLRSMDYGAVIEHAKGLDYIQEEKPNDTKPVSNGCPADSPELPGPSEPKNSPEENSFSSDSSFPSPVKKVEFNLDLDLICGPELGTRASPEPSEPAQNKNKDDDSSTGNDSVDFFTEINLDEAQ